MSIKVTVDFTNGCYNITGLNEDKIISIHKPIRGIDKDGFYKENYSRRLMKLRKGKIRKVIKELKEKDPDFQVSKKAMENLDVVMYKALEDWDKLSGWKTDYAKQYLKAVLQKINTQDKPGMPLNMFKEYCRDTRAENLKKLGIDITYNVGLLNTSKSMSFLDKIRGILIARKQKQFTGAEVINNIYIKESVYTKDKDLVYKDIPYDLEEKIIRETEKQFDLREIELKNTEKHETKTQKDYVSKPSNIKEDFDEEEKIISSKQNDAQAKVETPENSELKRLKEQYEKLIEEGKNITVSKEVTEQKRYVDEMSLRAKRVLERMREQISNLEEQNEDSNLRKIKESKDEPNSKKIAAIRRKKEMRTSEQKKVRLERKLRNAKDSIRNKKFISNKSRFKKIAIRGAATLLAVGAIAFSIHDINNISNNKSVSGPRVTYETVTPTQEAEEPEAPIKIETEGKQEEKTTEKADKEKSNKEKIKEFKEIAIQKYMDALVVGEKPEIGDMLSDETFSEMPDGSGSVGHFEYFPDYKVEHISIMTDTTWYTVRDEGKSLPEILAEHPDCTGYSIHFANMENNGGLGFVTENQLKGAINNQVNKIINIKRDEILKKQQIKQDDVQDIIR